MDIRSLIRKKALEAGIDPTHALTMASIESSFNPQAANKYGYKGLYQFGPGEWKTYGGGKDVFDPEANFDAFVGYHNEIRDQLKSSLGRDPTPQELYLGWQQGAAGASKLLNNADAPARTLVAPNAILANGGTVDMTGGQFADIWRNKYNEHSKLFGGDTLETKHIATVGDPAMQQADPDPRTANDADLAGYGGSPRLPDPKTRDPNYSGLIASGMGLLSAGQGGPEVQTWQPQASPVYRPQGLLAEVNEYMRRRYGGGLLGG